MEPSDTSRRWARVSVELENVRNTHGREHPLFVLRALLKHAWSLKAEGGGPALVEPEGWTFHPMGPLAARVRQGGRYGMRVVLPPGGDGLAVAAQLGKNLGRWLGEGGGGQNFRLLSEPVVEERSVELLLAGGFPAESGGTGAPDADPAAENSADLEWALDFHTPLALRAGTEHRMDGDRLALLLESRLAPLGFSSEVALAGAVLRGGEDGSPAPVQVRPWYLERVRWGHSEKHGPGRADSREDLGGMLGPLYLRGGAVSLEMLLPALRLAEEFHLGKGMHRAQGASRLMHRRTFFDGRIGSHTTYFAAFDAVREESEADPVLHASSPAAAEAAASLHALHDREKWCLALAEEMRSGQYRSAPPRLVSLQKKDGGTRVLSLLHDRDRVAQRALLQVVAPVLDRQLEESSHAWRAGRGVETARSLVAKAFREGLTWVVESDIAAYFDEIGHERMDAVLDRALPRADVLTKAALRAVYSREPGGSEAKTGRGIPQGSPLSPLLANLYLDTFDEAMAACGHRMVRYGDDFLLLCRSREAAEQAMSDAAAGLERLGLRMQREKTALTSFHAGFFFLGREFGSGMDEDAAEAATLRRTLFINTAGAWVGQDHDSIVVKKDKALLARVPLVRVSDLVFLGAQGVSTWLLHSCARRRIPVTLATAQGWHVQTLVPDSRGQWELAARQAARHAALGPGGLLTQSRHVVEAKLVNHLGWLRSLPGGASADAGRAAALQALEQGLVGLSSARSVESLRGTEGRAAAALYPVVNGLALDPAFHSPLRRPREKPDLWNTLYDAASSLLFSRLNLLLRSRGVNPYLGYLHSAADHYESLVCDLQEPFRARLDRFLLKLVNKRTLTPEHFGPADAGAAFTRRSREEARATAASLEEAIPPTPVVFSKSTSVPGPVLPARVAGTARRWRLTPDGYRRLIDAWERELRIRLAGDPATLGDLLASQVWLTCEYIQKHLPFLQFYRAAHPDKE